MVNRILPEVYPCCSAVRRLPEVSINVNCAPAPYYFLLDTCQHADGQATVRITVTADQLFNPIYLCHSYTIYISVYYIPFT